MRKSTLRGCVLGAAAAALLAAAPGPNRASAETEFKALVPWALPFTLSKPMIWFKDMVNEELKGTLKVKYLGAAEVVPAFEQFGALQDGVIDMLLDRDGLLQGHPAGRPGGAVLQPDGRRTAQVGLLRPDAQDPRRRRPIPSISRRSAARPAGSASTAARSRAPSPTSRA